ncbi:MAG: NAD-dependent epimerase/dehydratase family protein [Saprospiraceae bacterium]|nr:NAD-dependent epimerase/dehydratase family protein [Saprospiraceae bacterium]
MKILITGGAGFVGSGLAIGLKLRSPGDEIVVFDNLRRRGSELNLVTFRKLGILFCHGDVRNPEDFGLIEDIDLIIDAAAEPSVLAGLQGGGTSQVIGINLIGTINILNLAVRHSARLIFLSTSRVYSIDALNSIDFIEGDSRFILSPKQHLAGVSDTGISESFEVMRPRSLYGATKLASELLIQEYCEFFGLKAIINRCGVIAGPGQLGKVDQGVLVLWVAKHYWKQPLSYLGFGGTGKQLRDILHIDDLFDLIISQLEVVDDLTGMTFNVGGSLISNISLCELTKLCEEVVGNSIEIDRETHTRLADVRIYISDNAKICNMINWEVKRKPLDIVSDVFRWIRENETKLEPILK